MTRARDLASLYEGMVMGDLPDRETDAMNCRRDASRRCGFRKDRQ